MTTGLQDERVQGVLAVLSAHFEKLFTEGSRARSAGFDEERRNIQTFAHDWARASRGIDFSEVFDSSGRGRRLAETFQEMTEWAEKAVHAQLKFDPKQHDVLNFGAVQLAGSRLMTPLILQLSADVVSEREVPEELLEQLYLEINRNDDLAKNVDRKMCEGYEGISRVEDFGDLSQLARIREMRAAARQETASR